MDGYLLCQPFIKRCCKQCVEIIASANNDCPLFVIGSVDNLVLEEPYAKDNRSEDDKDRYHVTGFPE